MDALSEFLDTVRVEGSLFSRAEMTAPWGVSTRGASDGIFHAVVTGSGLLEVEGEPPRAFRAGDLLVMPHGASHVLRDGPPSAVRHLFDWSIEDDGASMPCVRGGGDGAPTSILCGTFRFDSEGRDSLLPLLPPVIHVPADSTSGGRFLDTILRQLADELAAGRPGGAVMVARLTDLLFVHVVRAWLEQTEGSDRGWLGALSDVRLSRALTAIHADAARAWTVSELAREAGMSRSAFFARFSQTVGEPPASYLTRWRMILARSSLRRTDAGLAHVAERVGYGSEAAFSRAFKRSVGVSPSAWRRTSRTPRAMATAALRAQ